MPAAADHVLALDTSVAVPLVLRSHEAHGLVTQWWAGQRVALSGHALAETYSVLTRLPGDARLAPADAARVISTRFQAPLLLPAKVARAAVQTLARLDIAGGATYDALVALAARSHGVPLATRDARAVPTYERIGVEIIIPG